MQRPIDTKGVIKSRKTKRYLSVPIRFTTFDYPFGMYWSLHCLYLLDLRLLITPLVSFGQTIQRPIDTKEVIKSRKTKRYRQYKDQ
jgi:hypothetical protein